MEGDYLVKTYSNGFGEKKAVQVNTPEPPENQSIEQLVSILALMTPAIKKEGHVMLAYLLEMAQIEAIDIIDKAEAKTD